MTKKSGRFAWFPYDWSKPTGERLKNAAWNPEAGLLTPKAFGWGYSINWYRVFHPFPR